MYNDKCFWITNCYNTSSDFGYNCSTYGSNNSISNCTSETIENYNYST